MAHTCHAAFCGKEIPPKLFMCRSEWYSLPKNVRDAIWHEYTPGQEKAKNPTKRYMAVFFYAIAVQAYYSGHPRAVPVAAKNLISAQRFRLAAIEGGEGDPLAQFDTDRLITEITELTNSAPVPAPLVPVRKVRGTVRRKIG